MDKTINNSYTILNFNSLKSKFQFKKIFFHSFLMASLIFFHNIILNCIKCFVYKLNGNNRDCNATDSGYKEFIFTFTQSDINKLHKQCNGHLFCFEYRYNFRPKHAIFFVLFVYLENSRVCMLGPI